MQIKVLNRESGALHRRLDEIRAAVDPRSRRMDRLLKRLSDIRVQHNMDMLTHRGSSPYAGVDRIRRPLAPPAESTLGKRKGPLFGFELASNVLGSRMITRFFTHWAFDGARWRLIDG